MHVETDRNRTRTLNPHPVPSHKGAGAGSPPFPSWRDGGCGGFGAAFALATLLSVPMPARASCEDDVRAFMPLAKAETHEIARRAALAEATLAMDEAGDTDEESCQRYLARAKGVLLDKPFRQDPGQTLGVPDDRRGVRSDRGSAPSLDAVPDQPVDGG